MRVGEPNHPPRERREDWSQQGTNLFGIDQSSRQDYAPSGWEWLTSKPSSIPLASAGNCSVGTDEKNSPAEGWKE